jgi:Cu(I)/Ag(I) efflux system periplasmic protein CusF
MTKLTAITLSFAISVALASCGEQSEAPKTEEKSARADDSDAMAMPAENKHGKATGTVTAIDTAKGEVTLDHGAIAELEWPPMTMTFAAEPGLLNDVKVGDKVAFELDWNGRAGTITKLNKAQ